MYTMSTQTTDNDRTAIVELKKIGHRNINTGTTLLPKTTID